MNTQKIELPLNTPIPVTLASLDGVIVPSRYGPTGQQVKLTAVDGRALYVPTYVGDQVKALGSTHVRLCKSRPPHGGKIDWKVERAGEQPDGTFAIPKETAGLVTSPEEPDPAVLQVSQPARVTNQSTSEPRISQQESARKRFLWDHGRELIDAQAALMSYAAQKHGGAITRDDVRALVVTVYIQSRIRGGR